MNTFHLARIFHANLGAASHCSGVWAERRRYLLGKMRRSAETPLQWPEIFGSVITVLFLVLGNVAQAHDPGLSVVTARVDEGSLCIHLGMARSDLARLVALPANSDGGITGAEFQALLPSLKKLTQEAFCVTASGYVLKPADPDIKLDSSDGFQFQIPYRGMAAGQLSVRAALLGRLPRGHRQFFSVRDSHGALLSERMLDATQPGFDILLAESTLARGHFQRLREFLALGVEHIATGYDHLLFLLGLLLIGTSLRAALKIITSFTLAHSLTLALATVNIVNIPPKIIEPLIAASIVIVGLQNILSPGAEKRWLLTFGFGLIHGCGFASALRDLGVGTNGGNIVVPLLSFNVGVELGQLAIAALVLPCIWKCQSSPVFVQRWVPIGSAMIVLAGGYWLVERTVL